MTTPLPTLRDLHQTVGGQLLPADARRAADTALGRVEIDSRKIVSGDVFWALKGRERDGAAFADDALARGAAGVVTSRPVDVPADRWALVVDDTLAALRQWAAWRRSRFSGTLIAVTGSVGKSTTRQMIHTVLASQLAGSASPANYNNHIGVPLSLLTLRPEHDYAVIELGASAPGEIAALVELARPKIGVITRVGDAHLGGFGSRSGVAHSKAELLAGLPADGRAVLGDDPWLRQVAARCGAPITWVGCTADCDLVARNVSSEQGKLRFSAGGCDFCVPVWGQHHLTAALVAVAVGQLMGLNLKQIAGALARFDALPMRCEVRQIRGATIINDAYNANPTAMRAALELLRQFDTSGRRIVVCGDMAELGEDAQRFHLQLGKQAVQVAAADLVIACGHYARAVVVGARTAGLPSARAIPCATPDDALPYLGQAIQPGDVVLVKGSRIMAMERLVDALQQHPRRRTA